MNEDLKMAIEQLLAVKCKAHPAPPGCGGPWCEAQAKIKAAYDKIFPAAQQTESK